MAKLSYKARKKLPTSTFAGPDRSYPINDKAHARNALARVSQFGTPALKAKVRAKVHKKFPDIGEGHERMKMEGGRARVRMDRPSRKK